MGKREVREDNQHIQLAHLCDTLGNVEEVGEESAIRILDFWPTPHGWLSAVGKLNHKKTTKQVQVCTTGYNCFIMSETTSLTVVGVQMSVVIICLCDDTTTREHGEIAKNSYLS